jgi:hypothetical protein
LYESAPDPPLARLARGGARAHVLSDALGDLHRGNERIAVATSSKTSHLL